MSHMRTAVVCGELRTAPEGDYFVTCSFDPSHVILRSRMPYHIVKCRKSHPGHNKTQCPYDATEYIDTDKLADHLLECESRRSLSADKYEIADLKARGLTGKIEETKFFHSCAPEQDEEWCDKKVLENSENKENNSDDDDVSLERTPGVGRGTNFKKPMPQKGMGRAAVLERIYREYQERHSSNNSGSSGGSEKSSCTTESVEDQFVDA